MAAPPIVKTTWKLTLAYDGSGFHGWQVQPGLATIQGTLADCLFRLTGEKVLPQGSGRTDAGVHALAQVCSFSLTAPLPAANLRRALNRILPAKIRVLSCDPVPPSFHARHCAQSKMYEYRIFERRPERRLRPAPAQPPQPGQLPQLAAERICSPFLAPFAWDCPWPLSLDEMQEAASLLLGTHDFTSMAASDPEQSLRDPEPEQSLRDPEPEQSLRDPDEDRSDPSPHPTTKINPVKTITLAEWSRRPSAEADLLVFRIAANGFLHHMVRNIVGTLVEIGRGSLQTSDLTRILNARDRTAAGPTAPAHGLYLVEVLYDSDSAQSGRTTSRKDVGSQDAGCPIHDGDAVDVMGGMNNLPDHHNPGCPTSPRDVGSQDAGWPIHDGDAVDVMGGMNNLPDHHNPGCPTPPRDVGSQDAEAATTEITL